ncbi:MAG TPA: DUF1343 domain-containing protein [Longimicrobiales bacterium]|nr:DUF1343 domain-containing protein [Longimicrobiales bacterium]
MRQPALPFLVTTLIAWGVCAACAATPPPGEAVVTMPPASDSVAQPPDTTPPVAPVLTGLEVLLRDSLHLVRGRRVGFLTNQTAVTSTGESGIDLLHAAPDVHLVALYGPEHGLRGGVEGGVKIESGVDPQTGVPVFSLYGTTQRPTRQMLAGVDVLLFDMQDIGARPYTFVWTMAMAMEAAAANGIRFVVLDRPNPITGRVEGPLMQMEMRTVAQPITGYFPVPLRHGMTVGEIARYINTEYRIGAELAVVPVSGWKPDAWFDQTGLPWIDPSPNIRSLDAALNYAGLVLFEATNLSVGRGTDAPFSYLGAPWLDPERLLQRLASYELPGVALDTTSVVPRGEGWIPFRGERIRALRFRITDREVYQPVWTALVLLVEIRRQHPDQFRILNAGMTQMLGSREARAAVDRGDNPHAIRQRWQDELDAWMPVRERYLLYH